MGRPNPDGDLLASVVTEPAHFFALEREWGDLLRASGAASATQGFLYARMGWEQVARAGGELRIVTVRRGQALVCVWPLHIRREGWLVVARHLGAGANEEYSGPLIRDDEDVAEVAAAALSLAKTLADVMHVYNLRHPSPITAVVEADPVFQDHHLLQSPIVTLGGFASFDAWLATKSRNFRQSVRSRRVRLSALGEPRFSVLTPDDDIAGFVDWLLARKLALVDRRRTKDSWVRRPESRAFYESILLLPSSETGVMAFTLTVDGRTIAGGICMVSRVMEYWITGYDEVYSTYSPGSQLIAGLVNFAIERGADFDFRLTQDAHKRRWMDREDEYATYELATTPRGAPTVLVAKFRRVLKSVRRRIGRILRRLGLL